jgi:hypothetical protein
MHKTINFPKESETSFVKSVREGGRGIHAKQGKKKKAAPDAASIAGKNHS